MCHFIVSCELLPFITAVSPRLENNNRGQARCRIRSILKAV